MTERMGLRERKKLETRRRLSDIATGLFLARGFDNVTIADVARAADVSVNTVFNYFKTKEDLFFDRQDEIVGQAARAFRDRRPGESAVAAFHREFLRGLDEHAPQTSFHEGAETWTKTVMDSPALTARQREIGQRAQDELAAALAEDTGAGPDDLGPRIAAAMIFSAQQVLSGEIVQRKLAGESLEEMRADVYAAVERVYGLLEDGIGRYAVKPPAPAAPAAPGGDGSAPAGK
ncbi:TetR/AcrR family transcriptional regulator [Actinomadura rugatobispora]|uniref:TetR/AcrR family transcriptional regulator n=1 Tax=Actinomadura rugatobispora TaxID=1994 RepID=A0ABW0ZU64_9ACTN|nr:TetR/AcrR family transcriptional regulator [Actinomadura rugatobispora]